MSWRRGALGLIHAFPCGSLVFVFQFPGGLGNQGQPLWADALDGIRRACNAFRPANRAD